MNYRLYPALLAVLATATSGCHFAKIEPASVGILFDANSGISEKILRPQMTVVGLRQQLITYPTSIKNASFVKAANEGQRTGDDSVKCSTVEGAQLPVDVTVAWHVDPANVVNVFESFGTADQEHMTEMYIRYFAVYAVNCVSGQRSIFDLMARERQQFGPWVKASLGPMLLKYGITVDEVYIGEVYPANEIHEKAQERIAKSNELEQTKIAKQKAVIDAQTTITNAERDASLNQLKAQMASNVSAVALRRRQLRQMAIDRWDGEPAMVGDGTVPFTDISVR